MGGPFLLESEYISRVELGKPDQLLQNSDILVYRLRTQNLRFVAPMPEQIETITMGLLTPQRNAL